MAIKLSTLAKEESTYIITAFFKDENNNNVIPKTILWSLSDINGNIINGKEDIIISEMNYSIDIVLYGDDLVLPDENDPWRLLLIKATYDSSLGNDLPLNSEARFKIINYKNIE